MAGLKGMPVEGEPDPKPWRVEWLDDNDQVIEVVAKYATETEMRAHKGRPDRRYRFRGPRGG